MYDCGYGALKSLNRFVGNIDSCQKIPWVQVKLHDEITFFLLGKRMLLLWRKSPKSRKGIIGVHCTETLRYINTVYDGINVNILMKNQGARPGPQGMHAVLKYISWFNYCGYIPTCPSICRVCMDNLIMGVNGCYRNTTCDTGFSKDAKRRISNTPFGRVQPSIIETVTLRNQGIPMKEQFYSPTDGNVNTWRFYV